MNLGYCSKTERNNHELFLRIFKKNYYAHSRRRFLGPLQVRLRGALSTPTG